MKYNILLLISLIIARQVLLLSLNSKKLNFDSGIEKNIDKSKVFNLQNNQMNEYLLITIGPICSGRILLYQITFFYLH